MQYLCTRWSLHLIKLFLLFESSFVTLSLQKKQRDPRVEFELEDSLACFFGGLDWSWFLLSRKMIGGLVLAKSYSSRRVELARALTGEAALFLLLGGGGGEDTRAAVVVAMLEVHPLASLLLF